MTTTFESPLRSDKLSRGLIFLTLAQIISVLTSLYTFSKLNVEFDAQKLFSQSVDPLASVFGCLSPVVFILQIIGLVHLVQDSRRLGGLHRRLSIAAASLYPVTLITTITAMILSFSMTTQGSVSQFSLVSWINLFSGTASFLAMTLLVFAISPKAARMALIIAVVLVIVGSAGTTWMSLQNVTFQTYDMMGTTYHIPNINLNRAEGLYPILTLAVVIGNIAYLVVAIWLVMLSWKEAGQALPETVS